MTDPIACGIAMRRQIAGLGNRIRALSCVAFSQSGSPVCTNSSLIANSPTITRIGGMPDSRSGLSEREAVETGDRIGADGRNHQAERRRRSDPLSSESPDSDAITLSPSTPSAKYDERRERQRDAREPLGQQDEHEQAEQAADETGVQRDAERFAGLSLPLHRVAVDHRRRRGVGAGRAESESRGSNPPYSAPT